MPRKKQKMDMKDTKGIKDIRQFFKKTDHPGSSSSTTSESTQPGGAADSVDHPGSSSSTTSESPQPGGAADSMMATRSQTRVKKENDGESKDGHSHCFKVKFSPTDLEEYTVDCDEPRSVLEVIKSTEIYKKKMKQCSDENIIIQLGKADKKSIVATHFPCSCIRPGKCLIITCESEKVEEAQDQHDKTIHLRENYSVFYIDKEGGKNTKTKQLFRNKAVKQFKSLCVYGEKGMTVEEALKRDGRFIDDLGEFKLSYNRSPKSITECTQKVDNLHEKEFKICVPRKKRPNDEKQQESSGASNNSQTRGDTRTGLDQRVVSVIARLKESKDNSAVDEIYKILRDQFPRLKEWMKNRFTGDSFQKELNLRKENFGKIQQLFSEVHRVRKLIKLGESVCKVDVKNVREGTGFVLFDNFILTNAHLFKGCVEGQQLKEGINVSVLFNYEDPEDSKCSRFQVKKLIDYSQYEFDYAILEPEIQNPNHTTEEVDVPPGLLNKLIPMPPIGEACIIGHPAGGVKKMDPTCIIEEEKREEVVEEHLHPYKDNLFIVYSICHLIKKQGIEQIMEGRNRADEVATYHTFMYHGSSGSPVFDADGQVFGLHTGGYVYGFPNHRKSVIEFAQPLLSVVKHFVRKLKERGNQELLMKVEEEVKDNEELKKVLGVSVCGPFSSHEDEPADTEPMETNQVFKDSTSKRQNTSGCKH